MRTIEMNLYTFDELQNDAAKERARDWFKDGLDYPWFDDAMKSIKAFCDEFGVSVKDYEIGSYGRSYLKTDADKYNFRGFDFKKALKLADTDLTGYYLDETLTKSFYEAFINTGDAMYAFKEALEKAVSDVVADIEYQYTNEAVDEMLIANEYEFDQEGNRA